MTLTSRGAATRRRIVAGAADEIRAQGVFSVTLDDVLARTATSKSQLFHYFPGGKEELFLAVARHEAERVIADQQPELDALTSWQAWRDWRDKVVARYREQGQDCPLSIAVSEAGRSTQATRAVVSGLMERWQARLAAGIRHMQTAGEAAPDLDPDRAARALLAGIQGGVLLLMSTGSAAHLEAALDEGIAALRRVAATA
ncbi:TetR/AcrR family transcriptional regulator [Actinacidiphila epipremni]|uniref:TetR/AcrR family transcriptional regulator n=1 Tax=Actinacidiphila epipremni TaxID=2053013 RepID=A0ABX1A2P5_9ACTN|nr:TetR/AcrR family transcriptional regulator [Actinacidiphila epipremni]NJP48061.1 TetR/AcrR family transcriptional regulator [Actinacidiphila epipremni]